MTTLLVINYLLVGIFVAALLGRHRPYDSEAEAAATALLWPVAVAIAAFLGLGWVVRRISRRARGFSERNLP